MLWHPTPTTLREATDSAAKAPVLESEMPRQKTAQVIFLRCFKGFLRICGCTLQKSQLLVPKTMPMPAFLMREYWKSEVGLRAKCFSADLGFYPTRKLPAQREIAEWSDYVRMIRFF